jgi:hypothetical protein
MHGKYSVLGVLGEVHGKLTVDWYIVKTSWEIVQFEFMHVVT